MWRHGGARHSGGGGGAGGMCRSGALCPPRPEAPAIRAEASGGDIYALVKVRRDFRGG